ncbi:hypothetical protein HZH68_002700 [Vespula germanica]|uniref:Reverse transcriptase domain-containing protein n=1 Tax=Vespula germanica TaxID=30212 RepID=A0A834NMW5_VESGE|nr:hypothetical protein HZH68_002700 [Vespula germanica]
MAEKKVIQPSKSEYAKPVVITFKKYRSYQVCVDYYELNEQIKLNHFSIPLIQDIINKFKRARILFIINLKITSFIMQERQYKFLKTPFGFSVNPTRFLRFVDEVFKDLIRRRIIFMYVDDIIITKKTELKKHSTIY